MRVASTKHDVVAERYQASGGQPAAANSRTGDEDAGQVSASPRRALADPLKDQDRNLPRGHSRVLPEPWRDGDALGIDALPFLALRLVRPHLERLGAVLRPHLDLRHGIRR